MPWWVWLMVAGSWFGGWTVWFSHQDKDHESDVLFALTFGLIGWPLLGLAQIISAVSRGR